MVFDFIVFPNGAVFLDICQGRHFLPMKHPLAIPYLRLINISLYELVFFDKIILTLKYLIMYALS